MSNAAEPLPRPLRATIETALADTPVVCVLGPRQAGKTTLVRQFEPEYHYTSLDDPATLAFAESDPTGFVAALPDPVILDEVQRVPELMRAIKLSVDDDRRPGRFLLTGSANLLLLPRLGDSLAGRMEVVELQPLSAAEQSRQPGGFLGSLLAGKLHAAIEPAKLPDLTPLAEKVVTGGFPEAVKRTPTRARTWHRQYLRRLIDRDVQDIARVREPQELFRMLQLMALRSARLLNISSLAKELGLRRETVEHYLAVCERLFLLHRLQPWHRNQAKRLIKTPKVHFVDSGLCATLAGLDVDDAINRRDNFGALLETFVVQQVITQAGRTAPELEFWHYRDKDQVEVDLVITSAQNVWGVEVKAAATATPADGHGLRRLAAQAGRDFRGGVLFYAGTSTMPLETDRCLAVPLARLWDQ